jgi:hypothetical protein
MRASIERNPKVAIPTASRTRSKVAWFQTVSRTLIEELKFNRSQVTSLDWESYQILKFPRVPAIL